MCMQMALAFSPSSIRSHSQHCLILCCNIICSPHWDTPPYKLCALCKTYHPAVADTAQRCHSLGASMQLVQSVWMPHKSGVLLRCRHYARSSCACFWGLGVRQSIAISQSNTQQFWCQSPQRYDTCSCLHFHCVSEVLLTHIAEMHAYYLLQA